MGDFLSVFEGNFHNFIIIFSIKVCLKRKADSGNQLDYWMGSSSGCLGILIA
jgi:hypothetical protein